MDRTRRAQGFTVETDLGARKKLPRSGSPVFATGSSRIPVPYEFDAADFTTDSGREYVTVTHNLGTRAVLWQAFDQDGHMIFHEDAHYENTYVRIWYMKAYTHITVVLL